VPVDGVVNLRDFGASGNGVADDGPALQSALDALATAGGGTLFVPAGRYAIITPVQKNFAGLASSVTIQGVASSTPVPPPTAPGNELTRGLDLVSEFAPKTGSQNVSISIRGLQEFAVKDVVFIGTPDVTTDALVTLCLVDIDEALIHHSEFYGLSSLVAGGSIVLAVRSKLTIDQTVFLGLTTSSGVNAPIVQNLEWKGLVVSDSVFADYGQRPELFSKMGFAAPYSWINIGNAAEIGPDSPRREAILRNVFLDEGGFFGISSTPNSFQLVSAPIDLLYITGLFMNVSNLNAYGHYLANLKNVLIEKSHYGWSHNSVAAINLVGVGNAILDEVECVADADTIQADGATGNLTVINSIYTHLVSQAQNTREIDSTPEDDPVQHVRRRFMDEIGRAPDAAAHFYWSNQILQCNQDSSCVAAKRAALNAYLEQTPEPLFAIEGRVVSETGAPMSGVTVRLAGSQNVVTQTNSNGQYRFSGLPTSGAYTVIPTFNQQLFLPTSRSMVTPGGDVAADFGGVVNNYEISGRVLEAGGNPVSGVTVTLSGSHNAIVNTAADGNYLFTNLPAGGDFTVTPAKSGHTFGPMSVNHNNLSEDQIANFIVTGTSPVLIVEEGTQSLAALRSTIWMHDPFSVVANPYFSLDKQTRIMLFALNLKLAPGEDAAAVTVQLEDSQHRVFNLPAEFVGQVPQFDWMTQIVIKLTSELGAGDFQVSVSYSGKNSNKALITIN
jgi:Carboxypeptidase regulatory-like domain/Pectate lyase superfamily protein